MRPDFITFLQTFVPLLLVLVLPRCFDYFGLKIMSSSYRPRSSLTRILINKMTSEQEAREKSEAAWYEVNLANIKDDRILSKFIQLDADKETQEFIDQSVDKSDWILTQIYHNFAKAVLSMLYTQTDINGMLGRGSMFVFSREQYLKLTNNHSGESLIDLGAGDGAPTTSMAASFGSVFATETSAPMRKILQSKNIKVVDVGSWTESGPFDAISCLNLLDRADNPLTILASIKSSLKQQGLLIVALVLPFKPYVESNPPTHKPSEPIHIKGGTTEQQLESAVGVIEAAGFQLVSWSRVPYLCEGDLNKSIYQLNDFVIIFKHK